MQLHPLFILSLTVLQGTVHGVLRYTSPTPPPVAADQNYTTVRVELDPDVDSVVGNCTAAFVANLTAQISLMFVDGVASETQSYPNVANPSNFFKNTVYRGRQTGDNRALNAEDQGRRKLCSDKTCSACCSELCNILCAGGGTCGTRCPPSRRKLRDYNGWWHGDDEMQGNVAKSVQFALRRWLYKNDFTHCMGDSWKLAVQVNYF